MNNIFITPQGTRVDLSKPAKSPMVKLYNENGHSEMDTLKLTGKTNKIIEWREEWTEFEAIGTLGTCWINEQDMIQ